MGSSGKPVSSTRSRGQGKRAGLDLAKILEAAGSFAPATLTLQAVADTLGVSRKAINYHVADRESLLALVAEETFSATFAAVQIAPDIAWQEACAIYAWRYAESLIETGTVADYRRLTGPVKRFLAPADALMGKMLAAGFSEEIAARSVALITNIAQGFARDTLQATRDNGNPLSVQLKDAIDDDDGAPLSNIERAAASSVRTHDREQLEISVEIVVRGLESLLQARADEKKNT